MAIKNQESLVISTRITKPLALAIERYLHLNSHVTPSDFIRDAIREKLRREAAWLLEDLLKPRAPDVEAKSDQEGVIDAIQVVGKEGKEV